MTAAVTAPAVSGRRAKPARKGTAQKLKDLYPEIDSWSPVLVTQAWLHWLRMNGLELKEPDTRDERFPAFLVSTIRQKMVELGEWR
jgi:hypothetical protein